MKLIYKNVFKKINLFFTREVCKDLLIAHLAKLLSGWDYYFSQINFSIQLTKLM